MDPRLRETLEALEDDAYIENDLDDDFFAGLNDENHESYEEEEEEEVGNWESEFKKFKNRVEKSENGDDDYENEDDKRSRTTGGYSMTSSIMFRNDKLRLLDEQFKKVKSIKDYYFFY